MILPSACAYSQAVLDEHHHSTAIGRIFVSLFRLFNNKSSSHLISTQSAYYWSSQMRDERKSYALFVNKA